MSTVPPSMVGRLAAEIRPRTAVWLDPALEAIRAALDPRARWTEPDEAKILVLRAPRVSLNGTIEPPDRSALSRSVVAGPGATAADPAPPRVIAVALLDGEPPDRIVARCRGPIRAQRVICEQAVLDVIHDELVIVELARGVSARDLQARVEPTLLVSPRVKEMVATAPPAIVE